MNFWGRMPQAFLLLVSTYMVMSTKIAFSLRNYMLYLLKVTTKEEYLSNFWENLEESRRSRLGSSGSSPDASKVRQYGSTSRLFENDTSIFSSGTDKKVDKPEQNNKGETNLLTWTFLDMNIMDHFSFLEIFGFEKIIYFIYFRFW